MGKKKKLLHFKQNLTFPNMFQPTYDELVRGYKLKGKWNQDQFRNENPIVLELGCGKGEYTIGLARKYQEKNFIGIDIKGARMWKGCSYSVENKMNNVAFIRTRIELIGFYFDKNEVSEIWLPFPDPQPRKSKEKKRMTSPAFLDRYSHFLKPEHVIHLKTDNRQLYEYTLAVIREGGHELIYETDDVYHSPAPDDAKNIQTFYELKFLEDGMKINYVSFRLNRQLYAG